MQKKLPWMFNKHIWNKADWLPEFTLFFFCPIEMHFFTQPFLCNQKKDLRRFYFYPSLTPPPPVLLQIDEDGGSGILDSFYSSVCVLGCLDSILEPFTHLEPKF